MNSNQSLQMGTVAEKIYEANILSRHFSQWRSRHIELKKLQKSTTFRSRKCLRITFSTWKDNYSTAKQKQEVVDSYCASKLLEQGKRIFNSWKRYAAHASFRRKLLITNEQKANKFRDKQLQRNAASKLLVILENRQQSIIKQKQLYEKNVDVIKKIEFQRTKVNQ